jgi:molybdenum cofactor guanylyltransferase
MSKSSDVTLAIIAGGAGSRLGGVTKGLLRHEGRTLIERLLDLKPLFQDVLLVADDPRLESIYGVRTCTDVVPGYGAPGGIHAALVNAQTPWVFGVGCDMPFVTKAVVEEVLNAREVTDEVVCFEVLGRWEPLLACYRTRLAPQWAEAMRNQPSFRSLCWRFACNVLPEEVLAKVDPELRAVQSMNTPQDLARWGITIPTFPGNG